TGEGGRERREFRPEPGHIFGVGAVLLIALVTFGGLSIVLFGMAAAGDGAGTLFAALGALVLATMACLCVFAFSTLLRRIELGPQAVFLRLPRSRGAMPLPSLVRARIGYSDIVSVDSRDEIYSTFGLPTVQTVYSVA